MDRVLLLASGYAGSYGVVANACEVRWLGAFWREFVKFCRAGDPEINPRRRRAERDGFSRYK